MRLNPEGASCKRLIDHIARFLESFLISAACRIGAISDAKGRLKPEEDWRDRKF